MITNIMKKWLQGEYLRLREKPKRSIKMAVYLSRIQKRIDEQMEMALWLALNRPDVLLGKIDFINEYGHRMKSSKDYSYERLKMLMLTIKALSKNAHVELVKNEQQENES